MTDWNLFDSEVTGNGGESVVVIIPILWEERILFALMVSKGLILGPILCDSLENTTIRWQDCRGKFAYRHQLTIGYEEVDTNHELYMKNH